jgi:low affinity Fe/Cu permease
MKPPTKKVAGPFERFAQQLTARTGSTPAFMIALAVIAGWAALGRLFHYSDTWQLVINTGTTIITFLMVFLIQRTQNKDSLAIHLKLNELIAVMTGASNRLVNVEDLAEDELHALHKHYALLASLARRDATIFESHSVDEAEQRHRRKAPRRKAGG